MARFYVYGLLDLILTLSFRNLKFSPKLKFEWTADTSQDVYTMPVDTT